MEFIIFKQDKPTTVIMLAVLLIFLSLISSDGLVIFFIFFSIALLLLGYRVSYKISKEYNNKRIFSLFSIPIIITKLEIIYPEYISLFGANFSKRNDWGPVAAIGTNSNSDKIVVRLFNGNKKFTIYKSSEYSKASDLAHQLSQMLKVELIDNVKN